MTDMQETQVEAQPSRPTVYFDGSCPLCRAEIGHYRRSDYSGALCFVDISDPQSLVPAGLTRRQAMERFHVRVEDGALLSGAAAFIEVWTRLPRWRWAARVAALPGAIAALEFGYGVFLPLRPFIARLFGSIQKLGIRAGQDNSG
jgi:predicted DCC family thiol-disulfide oxidoreductase YuxK